MSPTRNRGAAPRSTREPRVRPCGRVMSGAHLGATLGREVGNVASAGREIKDTLSVASTNASAISRCFQLRVASVGAAGR